ncbi:hypothetical protein BJ742DRAFT_824413 [Cladochytrium replicatum]|nr:hypothetical protein BJ742DRAFT_824413 [Cladochytrium replicatum]
MSNSSQENSITTWSASFATIAHNFYVRTSLIASAPPQIVSLTEDVSIGAGNATLYLMRPSDFEIWRTMPVTSAVFSHTIPNTFTATEAFTLNVNASYSIFVFCGGSTLISGGTTSVAQNNCSNVSFNIRWALLGNATAVTTVGSAGGNASPRPGSAIATSTSDVAVNNNSANTSLSTSALVGVIVGSIVIAVILTGSIFLAIWRRRQRKREREERDRYPYADIARNNNRDTEYTNDEDRSFNDGDSHAHREPYYPPAPPAQPMSPTQQYHGVLPSPIDHMPPAKPFPSTTPYLAVPTPQPEESVANSSSWSHAPENFQADSNAQYYTYYDPATGQYYYQHRESSALYSPVGGGTGVEYEGSSAVGSSSNNQYSAGPSMQQR